MNSYGNWLKKTKIIKMLTDIKTFVESEVLVNNINNGTDDWI